MIFGRFLPATIVGFAVFSAAPAGAADEWVVKTSPHSVPATVEKLTGAIGNAGATVAAVVDHAAAAQNAGMDLPPTTLVIFGNPKLGTPLMIDNRRMAVDLPIRVLIWQDGDATMIGYVEPGVLAERHGISDDHESIAAMTAALTKLTDAAIAQ